MKDNTGSWHPPADTEGGQALYLYQKLLGILSLHIGEEEVTQVKKAFAMLLKAHAGRTPVKEPYVLHGLRAALVLAEDLELVRPLPVICALLQESVRATILSINHVKRQFDLSVYKLLQGQSMLEKLLASRKAATSEQHADSLAKVCEGPLVLLILLADKLARLRHLSLLPARKQRMLIETAHRLYVPLSHRLGLGLFKKEMEDIYLRYTRPEEYRALELQLEATARQHEELLDRFKQPLQKLLEQHGIKFWFQQRIKSIYSIWRKLQTKQVPLDGIYDLLALRVILDYPDEEEDSICWKVYELLTTIYSPHPNRLKDWISHPKPNGYKSLHATLTTPSGHWIEVQIRTERMHNIAIQGVAAHWKYKPATQERESIKTLENWLEKMQELLHGGKMDSKALTETAKLVIYKDQLAIFTEKGGVRLLPKGASVMDFAVDMLGTQGFGCPGAYINGHRVGRQHVLRQADQVTLLPGEKLWANPEWGLCLRSARARFLLQEQLRRQAKEIRKQGRAILEKIGQSLGRPTSRDHLAGIRQAFSLQTPELLYEALAAKDIRPAALAHAFEQAGPPPSVDQKKLPVCFLNSPTGWIPCGDYALAVCCKPAPGDPVCAAGRLPEGIALHRTDCLSLATFVARDTSALRKVRWQTAGMRHTFSVMLQQGSRQTFIRQLRKAVSKAGQIEALLFLQDKAGCHQVCKLVLSTDCSSDQVQACLRKLAKGGRVELVSAHGGEQVITPAEPVCQTVS